MSPPPLTATYLLMFMLVLVLVLVRVHNGGAEIIHNFTPDLLQKIALRG